MRPGQALRIRREVRCAHRARQQFKPGTDPPRPKNDPALLRQQRSTTWCSCHHASISPAGAVPHLRALPVVGTFDSTMACIGPGSTTARAGELALPEAHGGPTWRAWIWARGSGQDVVQASLRTPVASMSSASSSSAMPLHGNGARRQRRPGTISSPGGAARAPYSVIGAAGRGFFTDQELDTLATRAGNAVRLNK